MDGHRRQSAEIERGKKNRETAFGPGIRQSLGSVNLQWKHVPVLFFFLFTQNRGEVRKIIDDANSEPMGPECPAFPAFYLWAGRQTDTTRDSGEGSQHTTQRRQIRTDLESGVVLLGEGYLVARHLCFSGWVDETEVLYGKRNKIFAFSLKTLACTYRKSTD